MTAMTLFLRRGQWAMRLKKEIKNRSNSGICKKILTFYLSFCFELLLSVNVTGFFSPSHENLIMQQIYWCLVSAPMDRVFFNPSCFGHLCCSCLLSPVWSFSWRKRSLWGHPERALSIAAYSFMVTWWDKSSILLFIFFLFLKALWQHRQDTNHGNWLLPAQGLLLLSPTLSCQMWQTPACRKQVLLLSHTHIRTKKRADILLSLQFGLICKSRHGDFRLRATEELLWNNFLLNPDGNRQLFLLI